MTAAPSLHADRATWDAAVSMIKCYDTHAIEQVAIRMEALTSQGDIEMVAAWSQVIDAIRWLQDHAPRAHAPQ